MTKKIVGYYIFIIGLFSIAFIIVGGNQKVNIVTSNVNNVKSILSTRIVKPESSFIPSKLVSNTPKLQPQKIASPSLQSRFLSPKLKNKKLDNSKKKGLSQAANLLQLYSGVDPNKSKKEKEEKEKVKDKDKDKKKRRNKRW